MAGTRVVIAGTGSALPERVFRNDDFLQSIETSDEWIRTRTGIFERRFVVAGETAATLGIRASCKALERAKIRADEIDLIICATITPDWMCPATANLIQVGIGARPIPAFDLLAACTGFVYALSVAEQFIYSGAANSVLIVGTEVLSRSIDFTDRNTCILFGDGAGAAVLRAADATSESRIHYCKLFSDGSKHHLIQVPSQVTTLPDQNEPIRGHLTMHGREVFRFAVTKLIELLDDALDEASRLGRTIQLMVPHQVNQRIIDSALESTGFPADRVMLNLERYGNTSAASVPIALDEAISSGLAAKGDLVLLVAFGGGLTWGSSLITL